MNDRDAVALIASAVGDARAGAAWADLGCGSGTFTRALVAILDATARIYAVDRDDAGLAPLRRWAERDATNVSVLAADFTDDDALAPIGDALDGLLLANALHFVADQDAVLRHLVARVRPGGRIVFVEYDRRDANPYVPFPIPVDALRTLAARVGLSAPQVTAMRPSRYQGTMYVAVCLTASTRA